MGIGWRRGVFGFHGDSNPRMAGAAKPQPRSPVASALDRFVMQMAQLWIVARCRCSPMRVWHSTNHLDCFSVDPWLVEEFRGCAERILTDGGNGKMQKSELTDIEEFEVDSLCSTARIRPYRDFP